MNTNMNNMNPQTSEVKSHIGENMKEYNTATMIDSNYSGPVQQVVVQKVKNKATPILLLVILLFGGAAYMQYTQNQKLVNYYKNEYSPINSKSEKKLNLDSSLVKSLYNMVKTTGDEDYANPEFDNNLKRYLAYRNMPINNINTSLANQIQNAINKFSELEISMDTMFGENHGIIHDNIQLGRECIGGFEYIESRGEYVQGNCTRKTANLVNVDKELVDAKSIESHIYLEEKVRYYPADNNEIPSYLHSGNYKYTFRLDRNYNYVYVNREYIG